MAGTANALTFSIWQSAVFTSAELADPVVSGAEADPDGDGRSNLLEYALGLDPMGFEADPVSSSFGASSLTLLYPEIIGATDLLYYLTESPDLQHWITPNAPTRTVLSEDATQRQIALFNPAAPASPPRWFSRLRVILQPGGNEPLFAPTRLSGTLEAPFAISLGWNDNARVETGYLVEKSSGGDFVEVAELEADENHWRDADIEGSTTYTYRVSALQGFLASAPSEEFTLTTPLDSDGDGLSDELELTTYSTDPFHPDSDHDGMPDGWEVRHGLNPRSDLAGVADGTGDFDEDGLSNFWEYTLNLDPSEADSDHNGVSDAQEDGDGDGMPNGWEANNGLSPTEDDAHQDEEPDGLTNLEELEAGTYPYNAYSDADLVMDGEDGWALDSELFPSRLSHINYVVIDLHDANIVSAEALSDGGHVLGWNENDTQCIWVAGNKINLPVIGEDTGSGRVLWSSINKHGHVVGTYADDDRDNMDQNIYRFRNEQVEIARGQYLTGISGNNQRSWFRSPKITNDGTIFTCVSQLADHNEEDSKFRYGLLKLQGTEAVEIGDFREVTVIRGKDGYTTQTPASIITVDYLFDVNDHGFAVGFGTKFVSSNNEVSGLGTRSVIIDGPLIQDIEDGNETISAMAQVVSEGSSPFSCGLSNNHFAIWSKRDAWTKVYSEASASRISGYPSSINAKTEIVGIGFRQGTLQNGTIIRNGKVLSLTDLNATHAISEGISINENGLILAWGRPDNSYSTALNSPCLLLPVDIAVDANRDGVIKFAGNFKDQRVAGKPRDKTEETKPFRFWCNDDDDHVGAKEEDRMPVMQPDSQDDQIDGRRDLEDFTRLFVHVGAFHQELANGTMQVGLKWKDTNGTTPKIKLYRMADDNGTDSYLKDDPGAAAAQVSGVFRNSIGEVSGIGPLILPGTVFAKYSETNPQAHLLFEASGEGKGQLCITIHKADGTEIGEGPGVWIDLVNVRKLYQRVKATGISDNFQEPSQTTNGNPPEPTMGWVDDPNGNPHDPDAPKSWPETKQYIVFVHGWNMSYDESQNFAETMFKRLWHRGYKGRYASMRWPTLDDSVPTPAGDVPYTYNASEYRAWKCGESLKQFINSLPADYARNVVAHSMGNIVVGSALKKGMGLTNYALLNGAVSAGCYDDRDILNQGWGYSTPFYDPDLNTQSLSHRNRLAGVNGNLVNFFLAADDALLKWEWNNDTPAFISGSPNRFPLVGSKPQRYNLGTTGYYYAPLNSVGQRLGLNFSTVNGRFVSDSHECMSYVAQSPMKAVGAEGRTQGSIDSEVDMSDYSFGNVHSAQFEFRAQQLTPFYNRLLEEFDLPFLP